MIEADKVKQQIRYAFADAQYPGDKRLRNSDEGDEPFRVERDFRSKKSWQGLSPEFLDGSPDGLASALSFFSTEAFRFYIPAYMIADIDGKLGNVEPAFHLTHGLTRKSSRQRINPQRYGDETWFDYAKKHFGAFTGPEAAAIVAYLQFKRESDSFLHKDIDEALNTYWLKRAEDNS